jgi:hypothetical protein
MFLAQTLRSNRWNEESQVAWRFSSADSCRLCRLFTPFIVNIASSFYNTWHKMLGSSVVLHRTHQETWRWRLLSPGYSSCASFTWRGYNCSSCIVHQTALWEAHQVSDRRVLVSGLSYTIFVTFAHCVCCSQPVLVAWIHLPPTGWSVCWICFLSGYWCWYSFDAAVAFPSHKPHNKTHICIFHISKSCHIFLLFSITLPLEVAWAISECSMSSMLWHYESMTWTYEKHQGYMFVI